MWKFWAEVNSDVKKVANVIMKIFINKYYEYEGFLLLAKMIPAKINDALIVNYYPVVKLEINL